jgi:hypothetical protein
MGSVQLTLHPAVCRLPGSVILVDFIEQRLAEECPYPKRWWTRGRCDSDRCS